MTNCAPYFYGGQFGELLCIEPCCLGFIYLDGEVGAKKAKTTAQNPPPIMPRHLSTRTAGVFFCRVRRPILAGDRAFERGADCGTRSVTGFSLTQTETG